MAVLTIENYRLRAGISTLGAELISLRDSAKSRELIWQADEAVWPSHAPVLFPLIGRLKDKTYTYHGKKYNIGSHGFARHTEFRVAAQTSDSVTLSLQSSDQTHEQYPFDFTFTVRYTINGTALLKEHIIKNESGGEMLYEVGGHEGYNLPFENGETMSDYSIVFRNVTHRVSPRIFPIKTSCCWISKSLLNWKMAVFPCV